MIAASALSDSKGDPQFVDIDNLSEGERLFLSIILSGQLSLVQGWQCQQQTSGITYRRLEGILDSLAIVPNYLKACDYMSVIFRLSKNLRSFLMGRGPFQREARATTTPGLFKTPYGMEHLCRLHPHQVGVSPSPHLSWIKASYLICRLLPSIA